MSSNNKNKSSVNPINVPLRELKQFILNKNKYIMGIVEFYDRKITTHSDICKNIPYLRVHLPEITDEPYLEVWLSENPVSYYSTQSYQFAFDGETVFGTGSFLEDNLNLKDITQKAYYDLFKDINDLQYPFLYRIWNYIPHITEKIENNLDRYKAYCTGRAHAFDKYNTYKLNKILPAATAIGSFSGKLSISFLASTQSNSLAIENPSQIPSYHYPVKDNFKPPYFSRAIYHNDTKGLYISGTASILGSESKYCNEAELQCLTTIKNIETLISEKNLKNHNIHKNYSLKDFKYIKVYIREEKDFSIIKEVCEKSLSTKIPIVYLKAQMCRPELLVEIEGII